MTSAKGIIVAAVAIAALLLGTGSVGGGIPPSPAAAVTGNTAFGSRLYVEKDTDAARAAARLDTEGQPQSAALIRQISSQPTAVWLGEWFGTDLLKRILARHVEAAKLQGATPVFVTYGIPNRDCGGYSAGGFTADQYLDWNRTIAASLAGTRAVVLVEPDSLAMLPSTKCTGEAERRLPLLRGAVDILRAAGLSVYLDGGNSSWRTPDVQAGLLTQANVANATGFYTNVANFNRTQVERDYAGKLSSRVGWKHYVIDVSRNGNGWTGTWCNPPGAALGRNPYVTDGTTKLDALLWVKHPGASDGTCNGGPAAGAWWESYALDLVRLRG